MVLIANGHSQFPVNYAPASRATVCESEIYLLDLSPLRTGLIRFKDFMRLLPNVDIYLRQVEPRTYTSVLADVKSREIYNLIVDTSVEHLQQFLRGILQIQMNEYKYHYLFTTFDLETFDLEDFKYNFVNVSAFRLIDNDDMAVRDTLKDMRQFYLRQDFKSNFLRHKGRMIEVSCSTCMRPGGGGGAPRLDIII